MLLVYLDESGIGDIKLERYVVVAGVIVEADQYEAVKQKIEAVRDKYVPEEYRNGFVFHATDLFQGSEKRISRAEFPTEQRHNALEALISIVDEMNLPVALAHHDREVVCRDRPEMSKREAAVFTQGIAATSCLLLVESHAQRHAHPSTNVLVTYENNDQARGLVKEMHKMMRDATNLAKLADARDAARVSKVVPLKRVIDTARFAEKSQEPLLQLADVCAYFIKRRLMQREDSMRFLDRIMKQLLTNDRGRWVMN